jgi:hypothetical protein
MPDDPNDPESLERTAQDPRLTPEEQTALREAAQELRAR